MTDPSQPTTLAIIPARGGSKTLPKKNIRDLAGKPLIAYTIEAALNSRITRTILSTDDDEIAETGKRYGVEVPFKRPPEISGDTATSLSVILHALETLETGEGFVPDWVVLLQPTSPFRTAVHINEALDLFQHENATSLAAITDVGDIHPYFMFELHGHHMKPMIKMENRPLRRQDLPHFYRLNGALYITKRDYYRTVKLTDPVFSFDMVGYVMDIASSLDINDYLDFMQAELMLKHSESLA